MHYATIHGIEMLLIIIAFNGALGKCGSLVYTPGMPIRRVIDGSVPPLFTCYVWMLFRMSGRWGLVAARETALLDDQPIQCTLRARRSLCKYR
jgi:hypothetical protein